MCGFADNGQLAIGVMTHKAEVKPVGRRSSDLDEEGCYSSSVVPSDEVFSTRFSSEGSFERSSFRCFFSSFCRCLVSSFCRFSNP